MSARAGQVRNGVLLLVWLGCAAAVFSLRSRGWIPTDEGTFSLSAQHVLEGGIPHRDFVENYTGGASYWNALAFRVFGLNLASLRLAAFLGFVAFVPAIFLIASRFGPPLPAALITLLAVAWSFPNYFSASVSWYNLFLATWGMLALMRSIETGRARWLFFAGLLAGVSCSFKIIGAEFLAASLLFLLYRAQEIARAQEISRAQEVSAATEIPPAPRRLSAYLFFQTAGLALFLAVLFRTVRTEPDPMAFLNFLAPAAVICGFLTWREFVQGVGAFGRRLSVLLRLVGPVAGGFLVAVLLFLVPFAVHGALRDLIRGIVAGTGEHVGAIHTLLPRPSALWPAVPYTAVLCAGALAPSRLGRPLLFLLALVLPAALWLSGVSEQIYRDVWHSARFLGVSVVFAACLALREAHRSAAYGWSSETRQRVFLLAAVVALLGLVQFPYPQAMYFLYFAPLVALAIFALVRSEPRPPRWVHEGVLAFYLLFAILRMIPGYTNSLGHYYERYDPAGILDPPRGGGLRVPAKDAGIYDTLIPLIQEKSQGKPIYAGPDAALVYFLSSLPESLGYAPGASRDPTRRPDELFRSFEEKGTRAVVLNREPLFAPQLSDEMFQRFETLFPRSRAIGAFVVRWRD